DRTLATSVLPTPASPSSSNGRCSVRDRKIAVASPSSARYPCSPSAARTSSTDSGGISVRRLRQVGFQERRLGRGDLAPELRVVESGLDGDDVVVAEAGRELPGCAEER